MPPQAVVTSKEASYCPGLRNLALAQQVIHAIAFTYIIKSMRWDEPAMLNTS